MKPLTVRINVCLLLLAAFCLCSWSTPANAQSVDWQLLPFFQSDWGGSHGQAAVTNGNVVTLYGQPVRTVQTFSGAKRISYDVFLPARNGTDGNLQFLFMPTGVATDLITPNLKLQMSYDNLGGSDGLMVSSNDTAVLWNQASFSISAQTTYHCVIDVSAAGNLTWIINNATNSLPGTIKVPYSSYKLEFEGWQPGNVWQVSNFAVVPEPTTVILVAFGLGLLGVIRRR